MNLRSNLEFLKVNKRLNVILGSIGSQIINMINSFFLTWVLLPEDYGKFAFGISLFNIFVPFIGFGLNFSLLQFGNSNEKEEFDQISIYSIIWGTILSVVTAIIYIVTIINLSSDNQIRIIGLILSIQFITIFPLRIVQSRLRICMKNDIFAITTWVNSLALFIGVITAHHFFGFVGILIAYSTYPIITLLLFRKHLEFLWKSFKNKNSSSINRLSYFKYGIYTSLGSIASQLLYSMDILMINTITNNAISVAIYKVGSLISVSGLLFCTSIMSADFIAIKKMEISTLKRYYVKLIKKMSIFATGLAVVTIPFVYVATHYLLDDVYKDSFIIHLLLMIGFILSFALRIPVGNVMYAKGYANYNVVNAYVSLLINFVLNSILIKHFTFYGAAIATTVTMFFGAILGNYLFCKHIFKKGDI